MQIKNFVEEECKKPTSKYGYEPFYCHFQPMVKYTKRLAKELGADIEIVEIAGRLHDIGSIIHGHRDHHITSAVTAEKKLKELKYPDEKIALVKKCILNHRGSIDNKRISKEEKIIADADAMSNFENIAGIFKAAFVYENLNQKEAQKSVRKKLDNKFKQLNFSSSKK